MTNREKADRNQEIFQLREHGMTYTEIGSRFGISPARAREIYACETRKRRPRGFPSWGSTALRNTCKRAGIVDEKALLSHVREKGKIRGVGDRNMAVILYGHRNSGNGRIESLSEQTRIELLLMLQEGKHDRMV